MEDFKLYPYQQNLVDDVCGELLFGERKIMIDGKVSSGKSAMMCSLAIEFGEPVVISVSIADLIDQFIETFKALKFNDYTVIKAGHDISYDSTKRVVIAMDNTLVARAEKMKDIKCSLLICEEAHIRIYGERMRIVRKILNPTYEVGFTGTPYNQKGFRLKGFDTIFCPIETEELIEQKKISRLKFLVPAWTNEIKIGTKFSGEFTQEDLHEQVTDSFKKRVIYDFFNNDFFNGKKVKSIWFCNSVESAEDYALKLQNENYNAFAYHGKLNKNVRDALMDSFRTNEPIKLKRDIHLFNYLDANKPMPIVSALVSINTISVGFSVPDIDVGVRTTATSIHNRHIQLDARTCRAYTPLSDLVKKLGDKIEYKDKV